MKVKVDFGSFPMYMGDDKQKKIVCDIRKGFASRIYTDISGIEAHLLAEKIYRSEGVFELIEGECAIIGSAAEVLFYGSFADSWHDYVKKHKEE